MLSKLIGRSWRGFSGELITSIFLPLLVSIVIGSMPAPSGATGTVHRCESISDCESHQIDYLIIAASTFDEYPANA